MPARLCVPGITAHDQTIYRDGPTYPPSGTITVYSDPWNGIEVSRTFRPTQALYHTIVGLIRFDTAVIPDDATILGAALRFTTDATTSSADNVDSRSLVGEWYADANYPWDAADHTNTAPA